MVAGKVADREFVLPLRWQRLATAFFLAVIVLIAVGVRVWIGVRSGLWRDEGQGLFLAQLPTVADIFHFLRWHESHPPLFYLVMRLWMVGFGTSDTALLAPQIALSCGLVVLIYTVGCRVFGQPAAFVAALLAALSKSLVGNGTMVRPYGFLQFECLLSVYLLWKLLQKDASTRAWWGYVVITALLPYMHNWIWLVLCGQWAAVGLWALREARKGLGARLSIRRRCRAFLLAQALVFALFAPWLPALWYQAGSAGHTGHSITLAELTTAFRHFGGLPILLLPAVLLGALLRWFLVARRRREKSGEAMARQLDSREEETVSGLIVFLAVPVVALVAALFLSAHSDLLQERCVSIVWPCLLMAAGHGFAAPMRRYRRNPLSGALAGALLLALIAQSVWYLNYLYKIEKSNARELARAIEPLAQSDDLIVIAPEWFANSFNWYFQKPNDQIVYPYLQREEIIPYDHVYERLTDPRAFERFLARIQDVRRRSRRVWLITDVAFLLPEEGATAPPPVANGDWNALGVVQQQQIYSALKTVYGPPQRPIPRDARRGAEVRALLFTAPGENVTVLRRSL